MRINVAGPGDDKATAVGTGKIKDIHICRWGSGKVFIRYLIDDLIGLLAEDMRTNIKNGWDNVIEVNGAEGSGKSNLAYALAKAYYPDFDMTTHYVYDMEIFKEKLKEGDSIGATYWMDEGSNIANNRDWQSSGNKELVAFTEMMRSRGNSLIFCIPTHERLDLYLREHRVKYILHCEAYRFDHLGERARGFFQLHKRNPYGKMELVGYGEFPPMPPEAKEIYEKIKLESQEKKIKSIVDPDNAPGKKYKQMYDEQSKQINKAMLAMHNSGIDDEHIMDLFGIDSKKTFLNRLSKARGY